MHPYLQIALGEIVNSHINGFPLGIAHIHFFGNFLLSLLDRAIVGIDDPRARRPSRSTFHFLGALSNRDNGDSPSTWDSSLSSRLGRKS